MSYHVTVTCPACGQPLEAEVDMIEETEGDSSIPYGTRTYMALDDYTIDWQAHASSIEHAASISDDVAVPLVSCDKLIADSTTLDDTLVARLGDAGMQAEITREPDVD